MLTFCVSGPGGSGMHRRAGGRETSNYTSSQLRSRSPSPPSASSETMRAMLWGEGFNPYNGFWGERYNISDLDTSDSGENRQRSSSQPPILMQPMRQGPPVKRVRAEPAQVLHTYVVVMFAYSITVLTLC